MALQQIVRHNRVLQMISHGVKKDKISHAYCFVGPAGVGKMEAARYLARTLNCDNKNKEPRPCEDCPHCHLIAQGKHPDVLEVIPEGSSIKIEQIRNLQRSTEYVGSRDFTKLILIRNAELITLQGANSLLRFLEEPVNPIVIVLMTESIHGILPTIRSRCQIIRFSDFDRAVEPTDESSLQEKMRLYIGRDAREYAVLEDKEFASLAQKVIQWANYVFQGDSMALVSLQQEWVAKEIADNKGTRILDIWIVWLRSILYNSVQIERKAFFPEERLPVVNRSTLLTGIQAALSARWKLSRYIQPQSVLEQMVLGIQGDTVCGEGNWSTL